MIKTYTYCRDCDNVVSDSRRRHPSSWLCRKFKRVEGGGFVDPQMWVDQEPFMKCSQINGGDCPLWTARPKADGEASGENERNENQI